MLRKTGKALKAAEVEDKVSIENLYTMKELSEQSEALFHVKPEVLAGSLYGLAREHYSVMESAQLVQQFLKAKVK
ncbi:hypothetical protein D3C87_616810 [compost metagenome]